MFFNEYPYTNFHELNLDMILHLMKKLNAEWDEFTAVNKITNAGAWDITKQYQAWTVVSDNNVGYISLKPVPVGVAITNTEYWGLIADYNILITDLSNRISALENEMSLIKNRKFVVITDSYGGYTNSDGRNFIEEAFYLNGITDFYCFTQNGAGFSQSGIYNFLNVLQANESSITDKTVITDVIVAGGANDQITADMNNIIPGITAFITYVKANYPNAKIHIGHFTHSIDPTYVNNITGSYLLYKECVNYGADYMENSQYIMARLSMYQSDNVHPAALGISKLAAYLSAWIQTGHIDVHEMCNGIIESGTNATLVNDFATFIQNNGTVSIVGNYGGGLARIELGTAISLTPGTVISVDDVIRFSDGFIIPGATNAFGLSVMINDSTGNNSCSGVLYGNTIELFHLAKMGLFVYPMSTGAIYRLIIAAGNPTITIF